MGAGVGVVELGVDVVKLGVGMVSRSWEFEWVSGS